MSTRERHVLEFEDFKAAIEIDLDGNANVSFEDFGMSPLCLGYREFEQIAEFFNGSLKATAPEAFVRRHGDQGQGLQAYINNALAAVPAGDEQTGRSQYWSAGDDFKQLLRPWDQHSPEVKRCCTTLTLCLGRLPDPVSRDGSTEAGDECGDIRCKHPQGWHRKGIGSCLECGCTGFVAAVPAGDEQ